MLMAIAHPLGGGGGGGEGASNCACDRFQFPCLPGKHIPWVGLVCVIEDVSLVEFMYLVFTRMPGESYRRRLRSFCCTCVT